MTNKINNYLKETRKPYCLSLLVIYSLAPEKLVEFYLKLGFSFKKEQHGNGPIHDVCQLANQLILEIYPATKEYTNTGKIRLGFSVQNLKIIKNNFKENEYKIINGKKLLIQDPEKNWLELSEF